MKLIIDIDEDTIYAVKNYGTFLNPKEKTDLIHAIKYGTPLDNLRTKIIDNAKRCMNDTRASGLYMAVNIIDEYKNDKANNEVSENEYS